MKKHFTLSLFLLIIISNTATLKTSSIQIKKNPIKARKFVITGQGFTSNLFEELKQHGVQET